MKNNNTHKGGFAVQCPNCGNDIPIKPESGEVQQGKFHSMLRWLGALLLMFIPGVNIILLVFWAFISKNVSRDRKNWAIASIIVYVIVIILLIVLYFMFVAMFNRLFGG